MKNSLLSRYNHLFDKNCRAPWETAYASRIGFQDTRYRPVFQPLQYRGSGTQEPG
ncbi:MAG: hypothetical protein M0Q91_00935 [Methanoregula sp.]|nr:hypothetical protein [Methanoregula sp.]